MNFQNLGVPSHLVPDTALYCVTIPQYVSTSCVVYPDTHFVSNVKQNSFFQIKIKRFIKWLSKKNLF